MLIDLSHEVAAGLVTYPGLPAPVVTDFLTRDASEARYAPGVTFHIARIEMVANTGTYLDAPFHRFAGGADLAGLALERLAHLDGVLIDATGRAGRAIDVEAVAGRGVRGKAVLVDDTADPTRPAHTVLLGAGIPVSSTSAGSASSRPPASASTACRSSSAGWAPSRSAPRRWSPE